jgi:hypothetical protein
MSTGFFALAVATSVTACGIAPYAKNASCCQCAGYTGDQHACHWCPSPVGGCRYFGSAEYDCPGFIVKRSDCPESCLSVSPAPISSTTTHSTQPRSVSFSQTQPAFSPEPTPSMRPFSKGGVGYYGGSCDDFGLEGLSNISWFYDWCDVVCTQCASNPIHSGIACAS